MVRSIQVHFRSSTRICRWGEGRHCLCRTQVVPSFVAMMWHMRGTAHDLRRMHCCVVRICVSSSNETRGNAASISQLEYHSVSELG